MEIGRERDAEKQESKSNLKVLKFEEERQEREERGKRNSSIPSTKGTSVYTKTLGGYVIRDQKVEV
jgi:hypothetical protein